MMGAINWNHVNYFESEHKLIISYQECPAIPDAIINLYHNRVRHLDLSFNELTSLHGLSLFIHLEELILDNNLLNDLISFPRTLKSLKTLSLNNNRIENLDILLIKLSLSCPNLEHMSLLNNPVCPLYSTVRGSQFGEIDYQKYRDKIVHNLPQLRFLDAKRVGPCEGRTVGRFNRRKKISQLTKFSAFIMEKLRVHDEDSDAYNALPSSAGGSGQHKGSYSRCKFRYIGAQSEGNRFISNSDL